MVIPYMPMLIPPISWTGLVPFAYLCFLEFFGCYTIHFNKLDMWYILNNMLLHLIVEIFFSSPI